MMPYLALIKRDLRLSLIRGGAGLTTLFFFVVTASLFPFALGSAPTVLQNAAPGIVWVSAVLASLLSLEALYHRDDEDGTFDLLMLSSLSPFGIVMSKMIAHWVMAGLSTVLVSVVVSQMLLLPAASLATLLPSLLLGTVYMSFLGGMGAILTLGTRRPGVLLALLILPLYIPMLILGVMAMEAVSAKPYLLLQSALALAALPLTSFAGSQFLRLHVRS